MRARKGFTVAAVSALAAVTLVVSGCTSNGTQVETEAGTPMSDKASAAITSVVEAAMKHTGSTQALVGIWAPWEGDFVQGISADGSTFSLDTEFRAAQSSQAVICAALLSLANDGEIKLDRKIAKDLPRQVGIDGITYGQLCDGTSGLADFKAGFEDTFTNNPTRLWPERELIAAGVVRSPLSKPGAEFHASDTNALLLGRGLAIATQQPLSQILNERVYGPMGMNRSYFPAADELTLKDTTFVGSTYPLAAGELKCDAVTPVDKVSNSMLGGAGGTASTVTNLRDFYADYVAGSFESGATKGIVTKTRPFAAKTADAEESLEKWGFGLMNIGPLWGNAGSLTGTISAAFHDPKSGYSIVIALNNSSAGADYAKNLALKLTSVVAKNTSGGIGDLPWDEAAVTESLKAAAVCQG
jgi:D-alanyl-D-alanine carboxypeptidase